MTAFDAKRLLPCSRSRFFILYSCKDTPKGKHLDPFELGREVFVIAVAGQRRDLLDGVVAARHQSHRTGDAQTNEIRLRRTAVCRAEQTPEVHLADKRRLGTVTDRQIGVVQMLLHISNATGNLGAGLSLAHVLQIALKPLANTAVKLCQKSHEFRFGANLFMLDELETSEKNQAYKQYFTGLFNMATLPFYWDSLEPEKGHPRFAKDSPRVYRRPAPDLCIEFCEKHGIEPREHALAYEQFFPKWLYGADTETTKAALETRYAEIAARYADKIPTIEVTNEMLWEKGRTAFYDDADYVAWCFKMAEKYFPQNELAVNDATDMAWGMRPRTCSAYYSYIEAAILKGARIDAVGMQFHMFHPREREYEATRPYYDPDALYAHMDLFARFGKPLQVTEITVPSYSWEKEDEELQADILEYLYSIWFSHPAVEQVRNEICPYGQMKSLRSEIFAPQM